MKIHSKNRGSALPFIAAFVFCGAMTGSAADVQESGRELLASSAGLLAYIDPGYGALIWQAVVASIVGAMFYFRQWFRAPFARRKAASGEDAVKKNEDATTVASEPAKDAPRPIE